MDVLYITVMLLHSTWLFLQLHFTSGWGCFTPETSR